MHHALIIAGMISTHHHLPCLDLTQTNFNCPVQVQSTDEMKLHFYAAQICQGIDSQNGIKFCSICQRKSYSQTSYIAKGIHKIALNPPLSFVGFKVTAKHVLYRVPQCRRFSQTGLVKTRVKEHLKMTISVVWRRYKILKHNLKNLRREGGGSVSVGKLGLKVVKRKSFSKWENFNSIWNGTFWSSSPPYFSPKEEFLKCRDQLSD